MNLNDFVVPNNKTGSLKHNARNLQKLLLDTTTVANESKKMEEKLEQLKENMSKEKQERGCSKDSKGRFGQYISSNRNSHQNRSERNEDNKFQKLLAGKLKIRVLKDDISIDPPQSAASHSVPTSGTGLTSRVKATISRPCETKTTKL
ncbi:zinc finger B-box domain-containing protein 1, partial [Cyprinodon tularosa]|uniref:zinc finger B-box domain-containing protein 1 n=1 Tax=Cyprinodon tularosa TaxID=77115 RepID=UPI0018E1DB21